MKHGLVCFGNEESYGLLFVGGELKEKGQEIKFFDAEKDKKIIKNLCEWNPDYVCFSPMSTFFPQAYNLVKKIKEKRPDITSVFGGHHATSVPEISELKEIDVVVRGPVRGSIEKILNGEKGVITTIPTNPDDLSMPARDEYYKDIPRMKQRYRKVLLSLLGCPFNCSYCSSSTLNRRKLFGGEIQKDYFLKRRSIETVIKEAKEIIKYPTDEIEWVDDDVFTGGKAGEEWLLEFINVWKKEINLPMYVSTTSINTLKVSDKILAKLKETVNCVGVGIQAIRPESLKLFNRSWDNEEKMTKAYNRLKSFGYNINLQAIVGLPVEDPIEDAMETVKSLQRIGPGSIVSVYPLQVYPNTEMEKITRDRGFNLYKECIGDTNTGIGGIDFKDGKTTKRLKNICKLATHFVKHNVDERWMRTLLDLEYDDEANMNLSITRYHDCVIDRLGEEKGEEIFNKIMKTTNLRY